MLPRTFGDVASPFGRQMRILGWHAIPMPEQRVIPPSVVHARHMCFTSVQGGDAASIRTAVNSIIASRSIGV